jgi:hypothetical protein
MAAGSQNARFFVAFVPRKALGRPELFALTSPFRAKVGFYFCPIVIR